MFISTEYTKSSGLRKKKIREGNILLLCQQSACTFFLISKRNINKNAKAQLKYTWSIQEKNPVRKRKQVKKIMKTTHIKI
jgi:hypothetical protein